MGGTVLCWVTVSVLAGIDPVYDGPAYASRDDQARPILARLEGDAMMLCVQLGMRPNQIKRLFGPPLLISQDGSGPIDWWYPSLGMTLCFPARYLETGGLPAQRVVGGIQ